MNYKEIVQDIKDDIPPVRFFGGKRYHAEFSGYTKKAVRRAIKRTMWQTECTKNKLKPVRSSDGLYTLYYHESLRKW